MRSAEYEAKQSGRQVVAPSKEVIYSLVEAPQNPIALSSSAMTTTTSPALARVRGFTVDLLQVLKTGPRRTYALCIQTQKMHQYVGTYLNRMQNYGLVMKNGSFWNLTVLGTEFTEYLNREDEWSQASNQTNKPIRHLEYRKNTEGKHLDNTTLRKVEFQSRFDLWLRENPLSDVEKVVVDTLIEHYQKTRSKFILVDTKYELAERLNQNPEDVIQALRNLYQDRVAYLFRHGLGWKLGLYQAFVEGLEKQTGVSS
jgi:hypothetical protein